MNYSRFITDLSRNRAPDLIREIVAMQANNPNPDLVFLAAGSPNDGTVPYTGFTFTLNDGREIRLEPKEMMDALQYGATSGYPPLLEEIKMLIQRFHCPPCWENTDIVVTPGGQDGMAKAIEMMLTQNDYFVAQEPLYVGTLAIIGPYKPKIIPVKCDNQGMDPRLLRAALSKWNSSEIKDKTEGVPKILYLNPNASNPTGSSLTEERKREIYKIASEYNLIILEDDPYYFLQYLDLKDYVPSFLSMDVDGRVIRFDSFSKLISAGIRLGFATGPKQLIERIQLHMQSAYCHSSGLAQITVFKTLEHWGHPGLVNHVNNLRLIYTNSRDIMVAAAEKYLKDLCEWFVPNGGMFFWIKVLGVSDTSDMILKRGMKKNVILLPGKIFITDPETPSQYLRASYSHASPERIDRGFRYLSELIKEEIVLQNENKQ